MGMGATYPIRNAAAHARNANDAPPVPVLDHLLRGRLRRDQHPRHVHAEHPVRVVGRVFQRGRLLLDSGRGDQAIESAVRGCDVLDDLVERGGVAHVDLAVVQGGVEVFGRALRYGREVFGGFGEPVKGVYWRGRESLASCVHSDLIQDVPMAPASSTLR